MSVFQTRSLYKAISSASCFVAVVVVSGCGSDDDNKQAIVVPVNNGLVADATIYRTAPSEFLTQNELHRENATANAGSQELFAKTLRKQWCWSAENVGPPPDFFVHDSVPTTKIFDDVYFMGMVWVSQYLFKVPDGLFLLDALSSEDDVKAITVPEIEALGLNPEDIVAVMPTHGHGDHDGGALHLQTTFGTSVYLGSGDANGKTYTVTPVDSSNMEPQLYNFGGMEVTLLSTPGHTPGTLSGIIPVNYNGIPHKIAFWGGTGMPSTLETSLQYLDGAERLWRLAEKDGIDGTIHTHAFVDASLNHISDIRENGLGENNPFLPGHADAMRSLTMLRNCAASKVTALDTTAELAEWRYSTVTAASTWIKGQASNLSASARVSSPYGIVTDGSVTFTFASGGESCSANVGTDGIATCTVTSTSDTQTTVLASYTGTETSTVVNLPGTTTVSVQALN
jgi:glyoxylase-like metal-dependent hydrolase (beta-lactamase superfamily II)